MVKYLRIDGTDILPLIEAGGLKWSSNDLDSSDAGRTLDGLMHRGKIGSKKKLELSCKPLTEEQASTLFSLLAPEFVTVEYGDPKDGPSVKTMYNSNCNATLPTIYEDGYALWDDVSFSLIER